MKTAITAGVMYTPAERLENPVVILDGGTIEACGSRESLSIPPAARLLEYPNYVLAPGFIDIHLHGAAGHDVMSSDAAGFRNIGRFLTKHGVTSYCPCTVTAAEEELLASIEQIAAAIEQYSPDGAGARPLGIHVEGPFISQARRGVHPPMHVREPSVKGFLSLWNASRGTMRMLTLAPELEHAIEVIRAAREKGVVVSIGHSNSGVEEVERAVAAGATHATHTFNGMRRMEHRDPGMLGVILRDSHISADIICDGMHVDPAVVDLFLRAKGPDLAVLISDATSATGMPDGKYKLGSFEVSVKGLRCEAHGKLAGSVLTLDVAVRNVMNFAGWQLQHAIKLVTVNPARVLGIQDKKGTLAAGMDADLAVLTPSGEVVNTFVGGFIA